MGNKICKANSLGGAKNTINDILEFLNCGEPSDDEAKGSRDEINVSPKRYVDTDDQLIASGYSGLARNPAASPVPVRQHASPSPAQQQQHQQLPGESCLVTYDVGALGLGSGGGYPGQSMVVTGSSFAQGARSLHAASPPVASASAPQLQSTQSFEVDKPYKVGDRIELWSTSQQKWCNGTVDKAQGEWIHISYKNAEGRLMSKIMPNGHEHVRFHGEAWGNAQAPPRGNSLPSSTNSPQKGSRTSSPQKDPFSQMLPPSPGAAQTNSLSVAPLMSAASAVYKVGDEVEIWSTSQNTWCRGRVEKAEGEWVTIAYKAASGQPMSKLMPNGHEELQFPAAQRDFLTPVQSQSDLPPPPPLTASYKAGDRIEIWSTSQNSWRPGSIGKVDGEWVHVSYMGPGGQPMSKIMPNGHAHLRLQAGFAAPP